MKTMYSSILFLLIGLSQLPGQDSTSQSFPLKIEKLPIDRIVLKYEEAAAKRLAHPVETLQILQMLADSIHEIADPSLNFKIHKDLGELLTAMEYDTEQALVHLNQAIEYAELLNDEFKAYEANSIKAMALLNYGSYEEATQLADEIIQFHEAYKQPVPLAMGMLIKSNIMLDQMVDFAPAMAWSLKAQELLIDVDQEHSIIWAMLQQNLGVMFDYRSDQEKALIYYEKAEQVFIAKKDVLNLLSVYADRAQSYVKFKNIEKVDEIIGKIETLAIDNNLLDYFYTIYQSVSQLLITQGQFGQAKKYLEFLVQEFKKQSNNNEVAVTLYWIGISYRGLDNYSAAAVNFKKGYSIALENKDWNGCRANCFALYQTYLWRDKHKDALKWYTDYITYQNRVYSNDTQKKASILTAQLETLEKNKEIEVLEAQAKTEAIKKRQLWMVLLMGVLVGSALFYNQRQARKRSKLIQQERLKNAQLLKQQLEQQLHFKQKELTAQVLSLAKKNELLQNISEQMNNMRKVANPDNLFYLEKVTRLLETGLNDNEVWEQFLDSFKELNQRFFQQLTDKYSKLTANDLRLVSLMKMNLSGKEIASLLNISDLGVKKARYRLRKKLELDSEVNVQDYLLSFG